MARVELKLNAELASVKHKLEHGAEGEFSAHVRPDECKLLIEVIDNYLKLGEERLNDGEPLR